MSKIAVVGSGVNGLLAAHGLLKQGHQVGVISARFCAISGIATNVFDSVLPEEITPAAKERLIAQYGSDGRLRIAKGRIRHPIGLPHSSDPLATMRPAT
jgi:glycine/D-amino acid oxidase-like deaminating enzyme